MSKRDGTPLPTALAGTEDTRPVKIDRALLYLVGGALARLVDSEPLEQTGTLTPDEARIALSEMLYYWYTGTCETGGAGMEKIGTVRAGVSGLSYIEFTVPSEYQDIEAHLSLKTTREDANWDDVVVNINGSFDASDYYSEGRYAIGSSATWLAVYYYETVAGMVMYTAASTNFSGRAANLFSSGQFSMHDIQEAGRYRAANWQGHTQRELYGSNLRGETWLGGGDYLETLSPVQTIRFTPRYGARFESGSVITLYGMP